MIIIKDHSNRPFNEFNELGFWSSILPSDNIMTGITICTSTCMFMSRHGLQMLFRMDSWARNHMFHTTAIPITPEDTKDIAEGALEDTAEALSWKSRPWSHHVPIQHNRHFREEDVAHLWNEITLHMLEAKHPFMDARMRRQAQASIRKDAQLLGVFRQRVRPRHGQTREQRCMARVGCGEYDKLVVNLRSPCTLIDRVRMLEKFAIIPSDTTQQIYNIVLEPLNIVDMFPWDVGYANRVWRHSQVHSSLHAQLFLLAYNASQIRKAATIDVLHYLPKIVSGLRSERIFSPYYLVYMLEIWVKIFDRRVRERKLHSSPSANEVLIQQFMDALNARCVALARTMCRNRLISTLTMCSRVLENASAQFRRQVYYPAIKLLYKRLRYMDKSNSVFDSNFHEKKSTKA